MSQLLKVKNIKNAVIGIVILFFLTWALNFVLSAGVSIVDKNGCLKPAYACKSDDYLSSSYQDFVTEKLTNDLQCKTKKSNYKSTSVQLQMTGC